MSALIKQEKWLVLTLLVAFAAYPLEHWLLGNGQTVALLPQGAGWR